MKMGEEGKQTTPKPIDTESNEPNKSKTTTKTE
jgi:hypothetical protein